MSDSDFVNIVQASFFDPSEDTRRTNEGLLTQLMTATPEHFVDLCTRAFRSEGLPLQIRKTVGTVLKMAVKPLKSNFDMTIWKRISDQKREEVRAAGVGCLVDPNSIIRKTAADLVADVFCVDCCFEKSWPELLPTLTRNLDHESPVVQNSAIQTLGYICERLFKEGMAPLSPKQKDVIIAGLCKKLETYDQNTLSAMKSLEYSIQFISDDLRDQAACTYVLNLVMGVLKRANAQAHVDVVTQVVLCLGELHAVLRDRFGRYFQPIADELFNSYGLGDLSLFIVLNDFFQTLLTPSPSNTLIGLFSDRSNLLNEKVLESLLALLPGELNSSDADLPQIVESSAQVMSTVNMSFLTDNFENLFAFASGFIEKPGLPDRITALTVIESMICGPGDPRTSQMINSMFAGLHQYFSLNTPELQLATVNVLKKVALHYPRDFMNQNNARPTMTLVIEHFGNPKAQHEKLLSSLSEVFENLSESVPTLRNDEKNLLVELMDPLLTSVFIAAERAQSLHLVDKLFSTSMAVFGSITPQDQYAHWFMMLWKQFESILPFDLDEKAVLYIESLFINLNVLLQKMVTEAVEFPSHVNLDDFILEIFSRVYELFEKRNDLLPEPLLFLSSVIEKETYLTKTFVHEFLMRFVQAALSKGDRHDVFIAGISCLGKLVKIFGDEMREYVEGCLDFILANLNDPSHSEDTKIRLFFVVSDITAHCPRALLGRFPQIRGIIENAFEAVLFIQAEPHSDNAEFADALKETLAELLLCLLHGLYFGEADLAFIGEFDAFFPRVVDFGEKTTKPECNPTVDYLRDYLMLTTDYCVRKESARMLNSRFTAYLYDQLSRFKDTPEIAEVLANYDQYVGM